MSSVYPGALDTLATNKANATAQTTDHPAHHNDLADAVNKIEAELGTNPSAVESTVAARILTVESGDLPEFAAKGDLLAASGDNAGAALAVGTNGQVLTADSAQTLGVKWAASDVTQAELDAVAAAAVALAPATSARNVIQPTAAAAIGLVVKGAVSQSANLTEWQDSAGAAKAALFAGGLFDLGPASGTAPNAGGGGGDKIAMYGAASGAARYGFGLQAARLVAYVDNSTGGRGFSVRPAAASGQASSGTDAVTLLADGTIIAVGAGKAALGLTSTGADTGLTIGADTNLYRSAADVLKTDDKFHVVGELELDGAFNHDGTTAGFYGVAPVARAAAIASPTSDTVGTKAAIDAIRVALTNLGLTS